MQERVRLEAEAVLLILARCQSREWQMIGSEAIDTKIAQTLDTERREQVTVLASLVMKKVIIIARTVGLKHGQELHHFLKDTP